MTGPRKGDPIVRRPSPKEDVERELRAHLALRAEELEQEGWSAEDAAREAERLFGDRGSIAHACRRISERHDRAVRRANMWDAARQDVRYAVRTLARSPGFTLASIITLALGIGANAAIFSVTYGVLLRPLPYEAPDALVRISETTNRGTTMAVAWANFVDWVEESRGFESLAAYGSSNTTVLGGDRPFRARAATVSEDFWEVFRVVPSEGRLTTAEEHEPDAPPTVVISDGLWSREFGRRPVDEITVEVSGARARVVGVVAEGFDFPSGSEIWAPAEPHGNTSRTSHNWSVVARLDATTPMETAARDLDELTRLIVARSPDDDPDFLATGATVVTLREQMVGSSRAPLLLLLGAAALVLLVACTNIASTLLARGTNRAKEIAVRASLGAGRKRVVRQLLTESLVLATGGALAGIVVAILVTRTLHALSPIALPRVESVAVDGPVFFFSASVAVIAALLFGLYPALRLTRAGSAAALREGARGGSVGKGGVWRVLVGTEVALALILLTGSGLLVRSFQQLLSEDLGFDGSDVSTVATSLSRIRYEDEYAHALWYTGLIEELESHPGVASAGVVSALPVGGALPNYRLELDGDPNKHTVAGYVVASAGAFDALDVPLLRGRHFGPQDGPEDGHVAIVSQSFAEDTWPGENPIGKQVTGGGMDNFWEDRIFADVVGVVGDVRVRDVAADPYPTIYFPYTQRPFRIQFGAQVVVESTSGDAGAVAPIVRATIEQHDSDVPVEVVPQERIIADALASRRFMLFLLGGFSLVGLILAAVGIYGVVSYSVARRRREMGIRIALGAEPSEVSQMVVRSSMGWVGGGLFVGLAGALAATRLLESMLYGVAPSDPLTLLGVTGLLTGTALLASWLPARAGTRTDPLEAMRAE